MRTSKCSDCGCDFEWDELPYEELQRTMARPFRTPKVCDSCGKSQKKAQEAAEEDRRIHLLSLDWASICPPLYLKTDLARLPDVAKTVLGWKVNPKGLVVLGPSGRGKTRAVWVLLRRIFMEGSSVRAFTAASFARSSSDYASSGDATEWAGGLIECGVLFIDDLGKGRMTERNESDLFDICEQRISHERPIIITTNATGDELARRFDLDRGVGVPLVRRLREFCDQVVF